MTLSFLSFHFPYRAAYPAGTSGCIACCSSSLDCSLAYNNNNNNNNNNNVHLDEMNLHMSRERINTNL